MEEREREYVDDTETVESIQSQSKKYKVDYENGENDEIGRGGGGDDGNEKRKKDKVKQSSSLKKKVKSKRKEKRAKDVGREEEKERHQIGENESIVSEPSKNLNEVENVEEDQVNRKKSVREKKEKEKEKEKEKDENINENGNLEKHIHGIRVKQLKNIGRSHSFRVAMSEEDLRVKIPLKSMKSSSSLKFFDDSSQDKKPLKVTKSMREKKKKMLINPNSRSDDSLDDGTTVFNRIMDEVNGIDQLINEKPEPSALQQLPTIEPDKYADCDLSTANNEELITIIHYLREKNMNYQKDILNAIQDRNRFADIIEKTNNSLITLKENIDGTLLTSNLKATEYKAKIKTLQLLLAKEEEKNSSYSKKIRQLERRSKDSSLPRPHRKKAESLKNENELVTQINPVSLISGVPTKIRWSDKVRLDRSLYIKISEAKDLSDKKFLEKFDLLSLQLKVDSKEVGKTVTLFKKYLWNEVFNLDVTSMQDGLVILLWSRKNKMAKDTLVGSTYIPREVFLCDSSKYENWFHVREDKGDKLIPSVKVEIKYDREIFNLAKEGRAPDIIVISCKIISVRNVFKKDGSTPSPYAILAFSPDELYETVVRTETKSNSSYPAYNETFEFKVETSSFIDSGKIHISFWHEDPQEPDSFLGQVILPVNEFHQNLHPIRGVTAYYKLSHHGSLSTKSALTLNPLSSFQLGKGMTLNSNQGEKALTMGAFVSFGQLTRLQERVINAVNESIPQTNRHHLKPTEIKGPSFCDQCGGVILAESEVMKCIICGICCHNSCVKFLLTECGALCLARICYKFTEEIILPYGAYNNLLELLTDENLLVLTSLGTVCDQLEEVATTLLNVFESQGSAIRYLSQLISHEVKSCKDPNTIFRGNSLASKSLDSFMKVIGSDYLKSVLKKVIDEIFLEKKNCELDPLRMEIQGSQKMMELQKKNRKNLLGYVSAIVSSIYQSVEKCPKPMRVIFGFLQDEVTKQFPNDPQIKYSAVSGFIFLRFFCPGVLGPKLFGLRDDLPDATTLRTLTLSAKVLQNLANGVEFGHKESFMTGVNEFIQAEREDMKFFIDTLSNNWTSAKERIIELEFQIETENKLIEGLENTNNMYLENQDLGTKKTRVKLQKNIEISRAKVYSMRHEVEKLNRMCTLDETIDEAYKIDHGKLFVVDIEKELAAIHRQLSKRKDAVISVLTSSEKESGIKAAGDLVKVLDQLEEIRLRLEATRDPKDI